MAEYVQVETVNPRKKEVPKSYLKTVVGEAKRQVETKRVEEEVAAGSVEDDLAQTLEVCYSCVLVAVYIPMTVLFRSIYPKRISLRISPYMIVRSISYCCRIGRTKSCMNRITTRNTVILSRKR